MDKNKFFLGLMIAAVGLFMLIASEAFIKFAVIILGIVAILNGVFILYTARNLIIDEHYATIMMIRGWMSVGVGLLAVALPGIFFKALEIMWTIMAYTLAVYLLVSAGLETYTITKLRRNGYAVRQAVVEVIASLIFAVILFAVPTNIGKIIVCLGGISLIVTGITMAFLQWRNRPIVMDADNVVDAADSTDDAASERNTSTSNGNAAE